MSAQESNPGGGPREMSPALEIHGTEQALPPGQHAAFVAHVAAYADERLGGPQAPETATSLGNFQINGEKYIGAKFLVAPKTFVGKDQVLTGWHFKRLRYTRPMRVPDLTAPAETNADGSKKKATDRIRTECWSYVGGTPVQTADSGLRLQAYLVKEGFYTTENKAVLTLLDSKVADFIVYEKKRVLEGKTAKQAAAKRQKVAGQATTSAVAAAGTVPAAASRKPASLPYGHWRAALRRATPEYQGDGTAVGTEYVFRLLGPRGPPTHYLGDLPDVRESFAPDLPLEQAITRVMFALMRDVSDARLMAADLELAHAGPSLAMKGQALAGFFSKRELLKLTVDGVYLGNHVEGWQPVARQPAPVGSCVQVPVVQTPEDRQVADLVQGDSDLTEADAAPRMIGEGGQRLASDSAFRVLNRETVRGEGAEAPVGAVGPRPEGCVLRVVDDGVHTPTWEWVRAPIPAVAASAEGLAPPPPAPPPVGPQPGPPPRGFLSQVASTFGDLWGLGARDGDAA
jgi:hypothetical protein